MLSLLQQHHHYNATLQEGERVSWIILADLCGVGKKDRPDEPHGGTQPPLPSSACKHNINFVYHDTVLLRIMERKGKGEEGSTD